MESREKVVDTAGGGERKQSQEGLKQQKPTSTASPPSASSSPSHEFSFTISVNSSSTTNTIHKAKGPPSLAIDLSPADDIFFHGHLLPLHLLSHLPISPRSSTNSLESFTVPIKELEDQKPDNYNTNIDRTSTSSNTTKTSKTTNSNQSNNGDQTKARSKSKTFSLFGLIRWRKECELKEGDGGEKEKQKRGLRSDMNQVIKRYVRMVRPQWLFRGRRDNIHFRRQPYSFSGNLTMREKQELRGRRGEFSAPASMRTSPTNSGLLLGTATLPSSASDSTMEELQAAIQAAIAHCKNSIAMEEKLKC
ncbi:hypothetical protein RJ641_029121 [Dillenia turbinata]|uniref:BRI1 kinase inhibitor 1 n=1 Tax=Dillenia turbinata TaxID=194707 RepID=A0AAN8VSV4_9MAGN